MKASDRKLFEMRAEVIKALAHPTRLAIVEFLKDGGRCVCDIAGISDCDRTNISKHLSVLTGAGILQRRKEGLKVYYALKCPCILDFMNCIETVIRTNFREKKKILSGR